MTPGVLLILGAGSGTVLVIAAWLMLRVSDRDVVLAARVSAAQGKWIRLAATEAPRRAATEPLQRWLTGLGRAVMQSGLLPVGTRAELQRSLATCGFRSANALALFLGGKLVLLIAGPAGGWVLANLLGTQHSTRWLMVGFGFVAGLLAPDMIVKRIRRGYVARLEDGLADALDLMVICTHAGLSLEAAIGRVAREMRLSRPEVADEFELTLRELEVMASAAAALTNLAQRTGVDTLKRLVSTLIQTIQFGTPLSDALRTLSAEVRQSMLNRFEARAARLPVLLTLPMILFILPCVFLVVGGPAAIQVMHSFGH